MISSCREGRNRQRVDIARTGIGIAVQRGAQRPDIGSAEALKRVLLAAKSVGYSTGRSGVYLAALFESMGVAGDIMAKSRQVPFGATVGPIIASGEVEIGFQQMSELLHVDGINVIGPLPAEMQHTTVISCGIAGAAGEPDGARALVELLAAPTASDAIERAGLQPA
jgi:molybdate transport system substrate-binding protein